jgi:hypothetical protein
MPPVLYILSIIALVLYILFGYVLTPPAPPQSWPAYWRSFVSVVVIVVVLAAWYLLPIQKIWR